MQYENFSYGTVQTAPSPATSGTSLVLNSGEGVRFKEGWAWLFPPATQPLISNAEIVQITNISTDTLTIVRAQQDTTAKSVAVGWQVAQGLTRDDVYSIINRISYGVDAGSSDAYAITLSPAQTSYVAGRVISFMPNTTNTGAATLSVNGLGAQAIRKNGAEVLADGDILAGRVAMVIYDGTNFQLLNANNLNASGWQRITKTITRTGDHAFTYPGDATEVLGKGTKFRYRDGGSDEYGVIATSTHSAGTISNTLIPNTDYAMAAATITDTYISYIENPEGFPQEFNFDPILSNFAIGTGGSAVVDARWKVDGNYIDIRVLATLGSSGQSVGTNVTFTAPIAGRAGVIGSANQGILGLLLMEGTSSSYGHIRFNNAARTTIQLIVSNSAGTYITNSALSSTVPFTWAAGHSITLNGRYPF